MTDSTTESPRTDAEIVSRLTLAASDVDDRIIHFEDGKPPLIMLRDKDGAERLEPLDLVGGVRVTPPGRIATAIKVETEESLVTYAISFKAESSVLFASIASNSIVAVLDYHAATDADGVGRAFSPSFLDHRAVLNLPFSLEWEEWTRLDGKLVPQLDFVRFLEENRADIRSPDATTILEACRDLQSLRKVDFRSVVREDSENYAIEYAETVDARPKNDALKLPAEFVLLIPVYFEDEPISIEALLRWKIEEGKLFLGFKLKRSERVRQAVFKSIVGRIATATGISALYGAVSANTVSRV